LHYDRTDQGIKPLITPDDLSQALDEPGLGFIEAGVFGRFLRFGIAPGMLPSPQRVHHDMLPSPPHSNSESHSNSASTASISGAHAGLNGAASGASGTTPAACRDQSLPTMHRHHHQQQQHHHQRLAEVRKARQGALIASSRHPPIASLVRCARHGRPSLDCLPHRHLPDGLPHQVREARQAVATQEASTRLRAAARRAEQSAAEAAAMLRRLNEEIEQLGEVQPYVPHSVYAPPTAL